MSLESQGLGLERPTWEHKGGTHVGGLGVMHSHWDTLESVCPTPGFFTVGGSHSVHQTQTSLWSSCCPWPVHWSAPGASFSFYRWETEASMRWLVVF